VLCLYQERGDHCGAQARDRGPHARGDGGRRPFPTSLAVFVLLLNTLFGLKRYDP
jgi:hypothetical protein